MKYIGEAKVFSETKFLFGHKVSPIYKKNTRQDFFKIYCLALSQKIWDIYIRVLSLISTDEPDSKLFERKWVADPIQTNWIFRIFNRTSIKGLTPAPGRGYCSKILQPSSPKKFDQILNFYCVF